MKQNRRWIMPLLTGMLIFLAACSGGNSAPPAGGSPNEDASGTSGGTQTGAPTGGGQTGQETVEITIWDQPKPDDAMKSLTEEIFAEFEQRYPHIKVNHEQGPTGTSDRQVFVTAMAGGQGPDAYGGAHFPIIGDWVKQGLALDLTPYWENYPEKDLFIPSSLEQATVDGKLYGVPNNMYVMGLLYWKSLFEEAGLDPNQPPANWDEFVEYAKALTQPDKNQYGYALLGMEWADWYFEYYVWQAGGDLTTRNEDGTVTLNFTKEPTVTALQFYKDLKWTHQVVQTNVLQSFDDNRKDFENKRAAMILTASDTFGSLAQGGVDLSDVGFAPFPVGPSGRGPSQTGGAYWIINPTSTKEQQDAAWTYITYMMSKEVMEKRLQFYADNGIIPNLLSVRTDVEPHKYTENVPQDIVDGVMKAAEDTQLEYFLKERLTPYIVKPIQEVLTNPDADPLTVLKEAEELAQREVVDPYNEEVKQQ